MMMSTFAAKSIAFHETMTPSYDLPNGVQWIPAYENPETMSIFRTFMEKFYSDNQSRIFLFGINPGRFGAGITGVSFTDPILLKEKLGIDNPFEQKHELSAIFIHEVIEAFGGAQAFYQNFYITSVNPVGLLKDGKNYNYYDDKTTLNAVEPFIIDATNAQIAFGCHREKAFTIGQGQNFKYFNHLNKKHGWFQVIEPLPHPRWVLQYRRKSKEKYVDEYLSKLSRSLNDLKT